MTVAPEGYASIPISWYEGIKGALVGLSERIESLEARLDYVRDYIGEDIRTIEQDISELRQDIRELRDAS